VAAVGRGGGLSFSGVVACRGEAPTAHQRDRRNLTPDQLALVMGRHYNRTKRKDYSYLVGNQHAKRGLQKEDTVPDSVRTDDKLAKEYGVAPLTIWRNGKFAAAVETLKAVDPEIEQKVVTGKGPTLDRPQCWTHLSFAVARPPLFPAHALRRGPVRQGSAR
jgi:hypothetical protein